MGARGTTTKSTGLSTTSRSSSTSWRPSSEALGRAGVSSSPQRTTPQSPVTRERERKSQKCRTPTERLCSWPMRGEDKENLGLVLDRSNSKESIHSFVKYTQKQEPPCSLAVLDGTEWPRRLRVRKADIVPAAQTNHSRVGLMVLLEAHPNRSVLE